MSLRLKTLYSLSLTVFCLTIVLYLSFQRFVLDGFARLENEIAIHEAQSARSSILNSVSQVDQVVHDWAPWDETYYFLQGQTPQYVQNNLMDETFANLRLSLMVFVTPTRKIFYSQGYDLEKGARYTPTPELLDHLLANDSLFQHAGLTSTQSGLLVLPEGTFVVASQPVTTSTFDGPSPGVLLIARRLSESEIQQISDLLLMPIQIRPVNGARLPADFQTAREHLLAGAQAFTTPLNGERIASYQLLADVNSQPALLMRIDLPRSVYLEGRQTVTYLVISLLVTCLVFGGIIAFILERNVLSRILHLGRDLQHIGLTADPTLRVNLSGNDELTQLARSINHTLDSLNEANREVRQSQERYMLAVEGANDGIWDWDLQSNQIYYSPRWKSIFGYEDTEIGDSPSEWFDRVHPNDLVLLKHNFSQHMEGQVDHFHCEFRGLTKSGDMRWFLARGITECQPCSTPTRIAGSLTDITERKVVEERLRHDAMHDPVTGLNNRIFFVEQLKRASEHGNRREDYLSAVLFMDLDRFKMVNDGLGHSAGDRLLMAFGQRLLECVRFGDSVARFGGDEFIILLDDIHNVQDTLRVVERIQQKLLQPFYLDQHEVTLTASIGITLVSDGLARAEDILRDAATAMHQAKANGRACYQIFDGEMHAHSLEQLQMEAELRRAAEHHEFEVYYQPVISLASGSITAVEALVRWPHPRLGLIPPDQFIPLAEETGLISQIDEWVLRTACEQMQTWRSQGNPDLSVAVNVSASELSDDRLPAFLEKVLDETGLPAEGLQIEVTESASMKNIDHTIQIFNKLHSMGISISIDDFGTSYSSLAYLKRFPIQTIKVDRIFIKDVPNRDEDAILASAILSMGHILGLKVIAEGIENEAQLRFLHYQGCDEVQGYLFSPPRPAREIEIQLKKSYLFDEQFS